VSKRSRVRIDRKSIILGRVLGWLIRFCCWTLRLEIKDDVGLNRVGDRPVVMILWHNRIMVPPFCWMKKSRGARKMSVLTSASHDGTVLAEAMSVFGLGAIRGSSSRRGVAALIAMKQALENGEDLCVTPDGPRGPKYVMQPGAFAVAKKANALLVPIQVDFTSARQLGTWDGFTIPYPFSKVKVHFKAPLEIPKEVEAYNQFLDQMATDTKQWAEANDETL